MNVICLEEPAFYKLLEEVLIHFKSTTQAKERWIGQQEAMSLLNIKSKSTLQKLRDEGRIRYSQPQKKVIVYDRDSIHEYLDINARNTF